MTTNLTIILACLILCGCVKRQPLHEDTGLRYKIVIIEGCEYLRMDSSEHYETVTHKGNCTNHQAQ